MDANPYALPNAMLSTTYFATEARNATFRELWRIAPPTMGGKLLAVMVKLFRLTGPPPFGFALKDIVRCEPMEVPELQAQSASTITALKRLGYEPTVAMSIPLLGDGYGQALAFLSEEPTVFAVIVQSEIRTNGNIERESGLSLVSRDSATIWSTTSMRQKLSNPPNINAKYFPGISPEDLQARHSARLRSLPTTSLRRFNADVLWDTLRENELRNREFNLQRGVFRHMTVAEVEALTRTLNSRMDNHP